MKGMRAGAGGKEEKKHETEKEEEGDRKRKRQMGIRLRGHLLRGRGNLNLQIDCCPALTAVTLGEEGRERGGTGYMFL